MKIETKKIYKIFILTLFLVTIISSYFTVYAVDDFEVDANAAIIVETNTGKVIYEKDSNAQNFPASVTKVLTAILAIENCKLDETATVSQTAISHIPEGYVVAPLYVGEEVTIKDLLYALMLKSANDAAYVLAEHVGGSVEGFSEMMNKKAKEIGCKGTNFVNPNGIHNIEHYTTAYDMYLMSKYAMKNQTFAEIVSTYKYTLSATNKYPNSNRIMENTNSFINPKSSYYDETVKGIKTGTTLQAGNCLITDSAKDGLEFITVILGAKTETSRFSETRKMIDYAFDNYTLTQLHKKGDVIKNIEVEKATQETKNLNLVIDKEITVMNNVKITADQMKPEIKLNENITAPISQGQQLGTIKYSVDGLEYTAKLLAQTDVELKTYYAEIFIGSAIVIFIISFIILIKKARGVFA